MAYLDPTKLTCPTCGHTGQITIVVGVGPHSQQGDTPYRKYKSPEGFTENTDKTALLCPNDGTEVWRNVKGQRA
ncbi:MAG: hypothetical protein JKX69_08930 [Rhodobacteraceae bacterium]|nr:hypothetical protein [Paracoccaceae bacterium]